MSIDVAFRTHLATLTDAPIQQDTVSEDTGSLRIWFQRSGHEQEVFLDGTVSDMQETTFSVEVSGLDIADVQMEADAMRTGCNGYRGVISSIRVLGMFVNDVSDDYIPKSVDSDEGVHLVSFSVRVIHL